VGVDEQLGEVLAADAEDVATRSSARWLWGLRPGAISPTAAPDALWFGPGRSTTAPVEDREEPPSRARCRTISSPTAISTTLPSFGGAGQFARRAGLEQPGPARCFDDRAL
jgi:hypothetical protein